MLLSRKNIVRGVGWLMLMLLIVMSLVKLPPSNINVANGDKVLHLSSYFVLTYWLLHAYPKQSTVVSFGMVVLGCLLEWFQSFTPFRLFEWLDLCMNITGVITAYLLFTLTQVKIKYLLCQ